MGKRGKFGKRGAHSFFFYLFGLILSGLGFLNCKPYEKNFNLMYAY
jgi:hypothetical protein